MQNEELLRVWGVEYLQSDRMGGEFSYKQDEGCNPLLCTLRELSMRAEAEYAS